MAFWQLRGVGRLWLGEREMREGESERVRGSVECVNVFEEGGSSCDWMTF